MDIINTIKKNRPKISESSIRTYNSILTNLYKKMNPSADIETCNPTWFLEKQNEILSYLKDMNPKDRKLRLSALVVISDGDKTISNKYRSQMLTDIQKYNVELKEQKKSDKQEKAWISTDEIYKILENLKNQTSYITKKEPGSLNKKEFDEFQNYLILALYTYNPPRRLEYTEMKMNLGRAIEPTEAEGKYNFIKNKKFHFVTYKTSKNYGEQIVNINPKLYYIIRLWKKLNPDREWLLSTFDGKKLTPSMLTQRLNKIFGKKISVNMLRHIFISENVLKDMPKVKELENVTEQMGTSLDTAINQYKKV